MDNEIELMWRDIFHACEHSNLEAVRNFIEEEGVPIDIRTYDSDILAHIVAKNGDMPMHKYLLEKRPDLQNAKNIFSNDILHLVMVFSLLDLVKYLIKECEMASQPSSRQWSCTHGRVRRLGTHS